MDRTTTRLFRWDELAREPVTGQIERKIVTGDKVMVAHIWLEKGAVVPRHFHEAEQLSWTFSGSLEFRFDNGSRVVARPGDILVIPSNVPHEAVALEDTYEMDTFSPIRYDWLDGSDSYFKNAPTTEAAAPAPASAGELPARLVRWDEVPREPLNEMVTRTFVTGERATIAELHLLEGCVVPTHQHESEQLTWVRSGELELIVAGERHLVPAGSVLRIPSNLPHQATAVKETRVVDLFSPIREDWLQNADAYLRSAKAAR